MSQSMIEAQKEVFKVSTCEGSRLSFCCKPHEVVKIVSANYGRTNATACVASDNVNCVSASSVAKVQAACNYKVKCSLLASNAVFGDPCEGTPKYLEVSYRCLDNRNPCKREPNTCGRGANCKARNGEPVCICNGQVISRTAKCPGPEAVCLYV